MIRDLDDKVLGQNSNSSLLPLPCRHFFIASSLWPYLARFLTRPVGRPCFCLAGSLTVGQAIGGAVSMARENTVGLSGCSLWNELMSFLRC